MLYTGKGDKGDTSFFGCNQRFSKSSEAADALGSVDEINSFLGFCKIKSKNFKFLILNFNLSAVLGQIQQDLFIIQASLAGADKKIALEKISYLEKIIVEIEKELPEIKTFFINGGIELAALLDYARAVARRAERRVVEFSEKEKDKVQPEILAYLNRLSSLLYAFARFVNFKSGIKENPPTYN